jgi:hypothetical protein
VLDQETVDRIKDCKRHGFPICLEKALDTIFKEPASEAITERIITKLALRQQYITSASQIWDTYDRVLTEIGVELGEGVARVAELESVNEMEVMSGCNHCPLYRRQVCKPVSSW